MEGFSDKLKTCLQDEAAFCTAACPFHMDMRDFAEKMRRKSFNSAFKTYRNSVGFPAIVAALCHRPCQSVCPLRDAGGSINIGLLEAASLAHAKNTEPTEYNLPKKTARIAIIGAGLSGMACALRLCTKKYQVDIYEQSSSIGGSLLNILPRDLILSDIEKQFRHEEYTLHLNTRIDNLDDLQCEAVYVATGSGGSDFGLLPSEKGTFGSKRPGIFFGGSIIGSQGVTAIADGLQAAIPIEAYIKTGHANAIIPGNQTHMYLDSHALKYSETVKPSADGYTPDEAAAEARRCLRCSCDSCKRHCDMMRYFNKYPQRLKDEVDVTIYPATLDGKGTLAKLPVSSCNQCGLCKEVCPLDIDMGEFLLWSRRELHKKIALPWAYHDFWLRDMLFSSGDEAYICRRPAGSGESRYVFFPGCQLGASDLRYVTAPYELLLKHHPDTAIMLGCCGAPAVWAGDDKLHDSVLQSIKKDMESLGNPTVIFACPTCHQMFSRYLPTVEGVFLYELIASWPEDIPSLVQSGITEAAVFDPCTSRHEFGLQQAVRNIAKAMGIGLKPLPYEGKMAQCCTWGGQVSIANPTYAEQVSRERTEQSALPYITYCVNCRDIFAARDKECCHLSDLLFDLNGWHRQPPSITERRQNRIKLKKELLQKYWGEEHMTENYEEKYRVHIPEEVKAKLNSEMILEEEAAAAVRYCEDTGNKVTDPSLCTFSGYMVSGYTTVWVEYAVNGHTCTLINAYSHRMSIKEV